MDAVIAVATAGTTAIISVVAMDSVSMGHHMNFTASVHEIELELFQQRGQGFPHSLSNQLSNDPSFKDLSD